MNSNTKSIERAITEGYTFKTGQYISRGWNIFTKHGGLFVGFFLLAILINGVLIKIESLQPGLIFIRLLINPPLVAGFYIVALEAFKEKSVEFGDFFKGFEKFVQLNLLNYVMLIILLLGLVLLLIPGIYLSIAYGLALPIILDNNLNFWAAMESSRKIVTKHWSEFFLFSLLLGLINLGGALLLGLGLLVTIPLSSCAIVAAYEDIVSQ